MPSAARLDLEVAPLTVDALPISFASMKNKTMSVRLLLISRFPLIVESVITLYCFSWLIWEFPLTVEVVETLSIGEYA